MLICPKCESSNVIQNRFSETGQSCLMCGTQKGFIEREKESVNTVPEQLPLDFDRPALTEEQKLIFSLLRKGRKNAIREKTLTAMTGISGVRVRQIIKHLTEHHDILVVSSTANPPGFYFPETKEEYRAGVKQYISRIRSLAGRLRAMDREAYESLFGQERLAIQNPNLQGEDS